MNSNADKLTDERFSDLLASPAALTDDAELNDLKAALGSYRSETLLWAERRSAVQPSLVPAARSNRFWAAVPQWSLAAIAAITVATGVVHFTGNRADETTAVSAPVSMSAPVHKAAAPTDIAADNRLLSSIDQALSYRPDSPADEFGMKSPASRSKANAAPGVED